MTLHLDLSPQAEDALRNFARMQGSPVAAIVSALIEETFALSQAAASGGGCEEWDNALAEDDFAVLVDLLGPEFARCVASGVLPPPCPASAFPK